MDIPDEVIQQAVDAYRAPRLHVNDTVHDRLIDMAAASQVIAEWAFREAEAAALGPSVSGVLHDASTARDIALAIGALADRKS